MLPEITVITPENFQLVITQVLNDFTNKLSTKLSTITSKLENISQLTTDNTSVNIGITGFDKTKQVLLVFKDDVLINESAYTISEDNTTVIFGETIMATSENPVNIKCIAIKSIVSIV